MPVQSESPCVSIILCTYNRSARLASAIQSIVNQTGEVPFELIVVDNNSKDDTAAVVRSFQTGSASVIYLFEKRQGKSYALATGIEAARAEMVAFTDDDVIVSPEWVSSTYRSLRAHPAAGYVGGKVLPLWPHNPPAWLTPEHWTPLAVLDYGDTPETLSSSNLKCVVGANMSFRRDVLRELGGFATEFQRVADSIGSMEDWEIQERYLLAGGLGLYDPSLVVHADVQPERMDKKYHRRWHFGHGYFQAIARTDRYNARWKIFGVPLILVKRGIGLAARWLRDACLGKEAQAFLNEAELCFIGGYVKRRISWRGSQTLPARATTEAKL